MGHKNFVISEEQRLEYAAGFLLDHLVNDQIKYSVVLEGADQDLESLFVYMMSKDYLELDKENCYNPTTQGLEKVENLKKRYIEYLAHFDLYCAVDLEEGAFAFEKIFEYEDHEWDTYLQEDRWADLRISIAWFKKVNPADFVFLSYLKEGMFDVKNEGWQFDLMSGLTWTKIEEIVDQAIQIEDLAYIDPEGNEIAGEAVIEDIVTQGAQLNSKLHAEEEHLNQQDHEHQTDYYDDTGGSTMVTTYESYYDPYFISPLWFIF